jgi:hypothetical protein
MTKDTCANTSPKRGRRHSLPRERPGLLRRAQLTTVLIVGSSEAQDWTPSRVWQKDRYYFRAILVISK